MLITKVILSPFGGINQREINFQRGLNVVVGANEAGKSTMVSAILAALFLPSDLKKNTQLYKDYIERFMPYGGGDTIGVTLHFTVNRQDYILKRMWGQTRSSSLLLPNGALVTNEQAIQSQLAVILGFGRGTYEGVFFARQEDMLKTVELLRQNSEASVTLSDILRAALIQAGGVSLDELAAAIAKTKKELLDNWDIERGMPKNNRSIDNPYVNNVGLLLAAFYGQERLKRMLRLAREAELKVEEAFSKLEHASAEKSRLLPQITGLESIENDIYQRARLEPLAVSNILQEENFKEINNQWPKEIERLAYLVKALSAAQNRLNTVTDELQVARIAVERKKRIDHYLAVQPIAVALQAVRDSLAEVSQIDKTDIEWLDTCTADLVRFETQLKSMRLIAKMWVKQPLEIHVQSALDDDQTVTIDERIDFIAEGRLLLTTKDWTLQLQAGQEDVETILAAIGSTRTTLQEKLQQLKVNAVSEAHQLYASRQLMERKIEQLQAQLAGALQGETLVQLAAAVEQLPEMMTRDPEVVLTEQIQLTTETKQLQSQIELLRTRMDLWEQNYGSCAAVLDQLVDLRSQTQQIKKQLALLAPLPADCADADAFLQRLKILREQNRQLAEETSSVKQQLFEAQLQLGEETAEEIAVRLAEAEKYFIQLKKKAASLLTVESEFTRITAQIDAHSFAPFTETFSRYLAPATGYRYHTASLSGALPSHIASSDGRQLPVELLSTGTTRGIALALRLAMAEFLMQQFAAFLMMDDPLVDLDPERKLAAAAMVYEFAQNRQIIVATCDPETADRLGGARITLQ